MVTKVIGFLVVFVLICLIIKITYKKFREAGRESIEERVDEKIKDKTTIKEVSRKVEKFEKKKLLKNSENSDDDEEDDDEEDDDEEDDIDDDDDKLEQIIDYFNLPVHKFMTDANYKIIYSAEIQDKFLAIQKNLREVSDFFHVKHGRKIRRLIKSGKLTKHDLMKYQDFIIKRAIDPLIGEGQGYDKEKTIDKLIESCKE